VRPGSEWERAAAHRHCPHMQDKRLTFDEWRANGDLKASLPFGQLPVLQVDGKYIAQSAAIGACVRAMLRQDTARVQPLCLLSTLHIKPLDIEVLNSGQGQNRLSGSSYACSKLQQGTSGCRTPMAGPILGWAHWLQSCSLRVIGV
jgi:hypothetical protein